MREEEVGRIVLEQLFSVYDHEQAVKDIRPCIKMVLIFILLENLLYDLKKDYSNKHIFTLIFK